MGHKNKTKSKSTSLVIALSLSVLLIALVMLFVEGLTAAKMVDRLLWPLARLLLLITIGLAAGQLIEAAGWTAILGKLASPLFRFANLGTHCSATFTTAFFSGAAANAMLYDFWKEGKINRFQLFMTNLANQLPAFFLHLPTTVFIVLPLTGWAGGLYFIITFLAALARFGIVLMVGRFRSAAICQITGNTAASAPMVRKLSSLLEILREKLPRRLTGVATFVVPIYIAVFLLNAVGLFEWTQRWFVRTVSITFIPVEALSLVVLSFAAEFTSGFATAGALLHEGVLSTKQTVLALLIGNVVAFPIRALRHQLPRLLGIFTPKMGFELLLIGQGFRIVSLGVVGAVFYLLF